MASGAQLGMPIDDTLSEPVNRALQSCQNFALFSYGISFIPFVGAGFTFWCGDATTIDWASASAYNTGFVANYGYNTLVAKNAQKTATIKARSLQGLQQSNGH